MFMDPSVEKQAARETKVDAFLRRRPLVFTLLVCLVAASVTVGLLYRTEYSTVLYQGF